jgi:general stress protein 26
MEHLPQGDLRLLEHPTAQRLLESTELARLAYIAKDGTPRVLPMLFDWTGDEIVFGAYANSRKLVSLQANPEVAITIDSFGPPPEVLQLRGAARVEDCDGIPVEYERAHRRYYGEEQGAANVAGIRAQGVRMTRIALRPSWVGVLDFQTRLPGAVSA